jgi:hypothetical protein
MCFSSAFAAIHMAYETSLALNENILFSLLFLGVDWAVVAARSGCCVAATLVAWGVRDPR